MEERLLVAVVAQMERERAGVDAVNPGDMGFLQVSVEGFGAAVVRGLVQGIHDKPVQKKAPGLDVLGVGAVVADFRGREGDDLSGVGGVGQNLLIAAHPRVENDFPEPVVQVAESDAVKDGPVRQRQKGFPFPFRRPLFKIRLSHKSKILRGCFKHPPCQS